MIDILYQDKDVIVCIKPVGVLSEEGVTREKNMIDLLKSATGAYNVFCVHRLDKAVGGVMVYAKNKQSAASLSKQVADRSFEKEYLAVAEGKPETDSGIMKDILFRDRKKNKSYVVKTLRKGAKEASLEYTVLGSAKGLTLYRIKLHTGRTHQIRVQFASRGIPLAGDKKYGSTAECKNIALFSHRVCFSHPKTKERTEFTNFPEKSAYPFSEFYKGVLNYGKNV